MNPSIDIVIPVYNEGINIIAVLESLRDRVKNSYVVSICYDRDDDDTLTAIRNYKGQPFPLKFVKNKGTGPHAAVLTGFAQAQSPAIIVMPADDTFNSGIIDQMFIQFQNGSDLVCASRFIPGGSMVGCPWLKAFLVRVSSWTLRNVARLPVHDATNGFRLFSRKFLDEVAIESEWGFTYSIELLVKAHRLKSKVTEVPAQWIQRSKGASRFQVLNWLGPYLKWYFYAFQTTYLMRGPKTVPLKISRKE